MRNQLRNDGRARRAAVRGDAPFSTEVLAVEEVGRIAAVVGARCEALEAGERGRRPLPAIAEHLRQPIRRLAARVGGDRDRVPRGEVRVRACRVERSSAPRMASPPVVIGRALPFALRWAARRRTRQPPSPPADGSRRPVSRAAAEPRRTSAAATSGPRASARTARPAAVEDEAQVLPLVTL